MRLILLSLVTSALSLGVAPACNKGDPSHTGHAEASQAPSEATAAVQQSLADYEKLRALLAQDTGAGVSALAADLAASARKAATAAPPASRTHLQGLAASADALKQKPESDVEGARAAFGELSRHAVALLVADPSLRAGRLVFECPMAPGYKKWIQTSEGIANPYMGKKMLECGSKTDWTV